MFESGPSGNPGQGFSWEEREREEERERGREREEERERKREREAGKCGRQNGWEPVGILPRPWVESNFPVILSSLLL
jgi:hypothetical protein